MPLRKTSSATDSTKSKKRSLRGLLTGESRKERRAKRAAERKSAIEAGKQPDTAAHPEDEDETVYGVNVENQSVAEPTPINEPLLAPKNDDDESTLGMGALQVILLLMDPKTRRFELLQLEFDSQNAVVRDVLAQVPHSVTEEALRNQKYAGVCDRSGQELYYSTCLGDVCTGSDILIALPENINAKECARLAKPILSDSNVIEMLRSSGIDIAQPTEKAPSPKALKLRSPPTIDPTPAPQPSSSSRGVFMVLLVIAAAVIIQVVQMSVTAPLGPGQSLSPNAFMSKCGYKTFLPGSSCEESSLIMGDDSVLTLYGPSGKTEWEIVGEACGAGDEGCKNGLFFNEDKTLTIGKKAIKQATVYGDASFSPFPFTELPKLKITKGKK